MNQKQVLATVNGKEITSEDVNMILQNIDPQRAMQFNSEEGRKRLLEDLINQELFYLDALDNNIEEDAEFQKEFQKFKETFMKQYSIRNLLSSIKVSDEELSQYYNDNKNAFIDPEKVRASHILVSDEEKANEIISEIEEGLSFEDAAKKYSSCPSNARGGDLGFFDRGKMVPEFEDAAFSLEIDELSKPVKTQFGYHIIMVKEKMAAKNKSFDEVRDSIAQQLTMQRQNEIYIKKSNELRNKYTVKIME